MIRVLLVLPLLGACTGGVGDLAANCGAQAAAIHEAAATITKLRPTERAAIDSQIELSKGYCSGTVPADPAAANKVVLSATAQISAIVAIAKVR